MLITSLNNEHIKELCKLNQKKYRDEYGEYIIEGAKIIAEAIKENASKYEAQLKDLFELLIKQGYVADNESE